MADAPSALFQPFRALGYITDDVPFAVQRRGAQTFVTVSVGKAWQVGQAMEVMELACGCLPLQCRPTAHSCPILLQIYNTEKLRLTLIGPQVCREAAASRHS